MEPTAAAGIALLCMVGAGLAMGTALAAVLLHRLHLEAQSESTPAPDPSGPVTEYRA